MTACPPNPKSHRLRPLPVPSTKIAPITSMAAAAPPHVAGLLAALAQLALAPSTVAEIRSMAIRANPRTMIPCDAGERHGGEETSATRQRRRFTPVWCGESAAAVRSRQGVSSGMGLIRFRLYTDDGWSQFLFQGSCVYNLRKDLAMRLHLPLPRRHTVVMCVRAGRYWRLTLLIVDLPHGGSGKTL
ncbi:uncharacterized protein LOC119323804 [Triticum dicoccoides]|uniref:uncharacterized protein LOC119323804 n=1 Tax=Triticum dicoccoides TaxID=85692 RepID=UPI00189142AF|nr:uncharacterized protein LOC119323804 [Triticum dicoccoides]